MSQLESDSKYWPPEMNIDHSHISYIVKWKADGIYPPKLTDEEKAIVDRQGTFDSNGNKYHVVWTLNGHPTAAKIGKDDHIYMDSKNTGTYTRPEGCWNTIVLDHYK